MLNQLADLHGTFGFSSLFISHDLSVVQYLSDKVAVMYLGRVATSSMRMAQPRTLR